MTENNPSYYSILPAIVRYDKDLTPNAKLLYSEITCLCNKEGYCWATNRYFAELYSVSVVSISNWISSLKEKNYIRTEEEIRPDNSVKRLIFITDVALIGAKKIFNGAQNNNGIDENNLYGGAKESLIDNTKFNNKENIKSRIKETHVNVRGDIFFQRDYNIPIKLVNSWDDINWDRIPQEAIPSILEFFKFRKEEMRKPVRSGRMANGILNDIRGNTKEQIEYKVNKAMTSGGGWISLKPEYFEGKEKKTSSLDFIKNMK